MGSKLTIQMFGPMEVTLSGESVTTKLSAKSLAILGFLMCNDQHRVSREKLAFMLWSESWDTANYNLRYNLWNIKKVIPPDENGEAFLITSKDMCYINPKYCFTSDLTRLEDLRTLSAEEISREQLSEMKAILKRELMEKFYIRDSGDFNDWLLFERTRCQKLEQQILERLLADYTAAQDPDGIRSTLEDLLHLSPYEEEYYCRMMRLCIEQGDRPTAIQYYQKCKELLHNDLNLSPSKQLRELYLDLIGPEQNSEGSQAQFRALNVSINVWEGSRDIPGIVLSQLLAVVVNSCSRTAISRIPQVFLEDLASVQPLLIPACGLDGGCRQISRPRLLNSMCGFFDRLSQIYRISIRIDNSAQADKFSYTALQYLQHTCPGSITLLWDSPPE